MPLEHDPSPRFTLDQRDAILDLAARLQVQHEATVGADDLVREAEAAGIDARFVYEATVRLGRKSRPAAPLRGAVFAFSLLALQAVVTMLVGHSRNQGQGNLGGPELLAGIGISLLLSLWASRTASIRRYVPLVVLATWVTVWLAAFIVESQLIAGEGYFWVTQTAIRFGLAESLIAVLAILVRNSAEWSPRGRSFRLHRER